jgi:hypothetical protein
MSDKSELYIGGGNTLVVKSSHVVEMSDELKLLTSDHSSVNLTVKILANFENVPDEYHQVFLQMMSARYGGSINCYVNITPFEIPKPKEKKWYQIFK